MTILVTGATGTIGRQVVDQLRQAGQPVRALTRNPAAAELPEGVEVVRGDLTVPDTLVPALDGVTGMYLITFGGDEYAPLETGPEIVALARKAGVRRVAILHHYAPGGVEAAVEASDLEWTQLSPSEFMANVLEWGEGIRTEGAVREAFPNARSAMIHEADVAAVAVTSLLEDGHSGKVYSMTGPETLTTVDKVRIISEVTGREVQYVELSEDEAREQLRQMGFSEEDVEFHVEMRTNTPESGYTVVPTVEEVTGRPARTFAQWVSEHADAFRG